MKKIISMMLSVSVIALMLSGMTSVFADPLNEGVYNFVCVEGGKYLNVYAGKDVDGANVCVWDRDGSPEQNFKMVDRGGNRYVLYPQSSPSGRVLDANRGNSYSNPLQAGNNIDIWQTNDAPAQEWYIDDRGGGKYTIELVNARGLVVSCDNTGANGGNCSLQSYNGSSNQLWYLQRADGGSVKADSGNNSADTVPVSSFRTGVYSVKYQGTNLRSGPGLDNSVVGMVNNGTELTITEVSGEWGRTNYDGKDCWIRLNGFADFVREAQATQPVQQPTQAPAPAPTPVPETSRTGYVCNTGGIVLRVRAQANTNCEILGTIKEGSAITVKGNEKTNGFYKVDFGGRTGYCYGDYITFDKNQVSSNQSFAYPVNARITCGFAGYEGHKGTDFGVPMGTSVKASKSGTVTVAVAPCGHNWPKKGNCGCSGGWGNYVRINHGDGTETIYAHLTSPSVSAGQHVSQGQEIGKSGTTGWSDGPHLHFEIRVNGVAKNAMNYLK